jgi:hypothetical protein
MNVYEVAFRFPVIDTVDAILREFSWKKPVVRNEEWRAAACT